MLVELSDQDVALLIESIDKKNWSLMHIGCSKTHPKRVLLADLKNRLLAPYEVNDAR